MSGDRTKKTKIIKVKKSNKYFILFFLIAGTVSSDDSKDKNSAQGTDETPIQNADVMEHYKKRYIHQLENSYGTSNEITPPSTNDNSDCEKSNDSNHVPQVLPTSSPASEKSEKEHEEDSASSVPGSSVKASVDKKKEVIQKIARRKSVSRSQFRHNDIEVYKLGQSK